MKKLSELTLVFLAISLVFSGCMDVKTPTAPPDIHLLSLNKPVVVSAEENSYPNINLGPYADDGNLSTRWCSLPVYPAWIYIDLQTNHLITGITLRWEACALGQYQIDVSDDASTWTTILTSTGQGNYTTDTFNGLSVQTRYVRVQATGSLGTSGISLFEFEIYGN
jgi:cytochrome c